MKSSFSFEVRVLLQSVAKALIKFNEKVKAIKIKILSL